MRFSCVQAAHCLKRNLTMRLCPVCLFQVMVFVHARNSTVRTAMSLIEMAKNRGELSFFQVTQGPDYGQCEKQVHATCSTYQNMVSRCTFQALFHHYSLVQESI